MIIWIKTICQVYQKSQNTCIYILHKVRQVRPYSLPFLKQVLVSILYEMNILQIIFINFSIIVLAGVKHNI